MAEIGGLQIEDLFLGSMLFFCIYCVVTDIVCCGMPPNSASFISVLQVEKRLRSTGLDDTVDRGGVLEDVLGLEDTF